MKLALAFDYWLAGKLGKDPLVVSIFVSQIAAFILFGFICFLIIMIFGFIIKRI